MPILMEERENGLVEFVSSFVRTAFAPFGFFGFSLDFARCSLRYGFCLLLLALSLLFTSGFFFTHKNRLALTGANLLISKFVSLACQECSLSFKNQKSEVREEKENMATAKPNLVLCRIRRRSWCPQGFWLRISGTPSDQEVPHSCCRIFPFRRVCRIQDR